jgi:hypothetical protein
MSEDPLASIDQLCDAFEQALDTGKSPQLQDFLSRADELTRGKLLRELLLTEWEWKDRTKQKVRLGEYLSHFPENEADVREAFRQRAQSLPTPKEIGHYRIVRPLGAGGMGEVFLAEDRRLGRQVALKLLPAEWAEDAKRRHRFMTEARAASALNHPNVCVIHEVGETEAERPYLTMEFLDGEPLDQRMRQNSFTISETVEVGLQIADALDAAVASGVIHRDLKPANIHLGKRGLVKVLDFGLAKLVGGEMLADTSASTQEETKSGQIMGTPNYMSPEQAMGKAVDHRCDLFSLGIVLYELLTGRRPFAGASFAETLSRIINHQPEAIARFNYDVPTELERIVRKLLEKDPASRYQTPGELLVDLKNLRRDLGRPDRTVTAAGSILSPQVSGVGASAPATVIPELIPDGDVLLNFAPIDDKPLFEGRNGWVSQLYRHLSVRVEQLSGEAVKIARHPGFTGEEETDLELGKHVENAKAMVSVVSPPFVKRDGCVKQVEAFCSKAKETEGLWVENKPRLFKVMKAPVASAEIPGEVGDVFSQLFGFEFFEQDAVTGRIREFDEALGENLKQRFHERLYDLAYEICQVLRILKQLRSSDGLGRQPDANRRVVYLAPTTSDLDNERDRIRRELVERGHMVLPETPLPLSSQELDRVVRGHLGKCSVAIHLLGANYGVTPEDSEESLPCLQVRASATHARDHDLKRYLWMPRLDGVKDSRQQSFLQQVQHDSDLQTQAEVMEGNFSLLKREVVRWLDPPEPKVTLPAAANVRSNSGTPTVYLICEARDEEATEPLEDFLFSQGVEVSLPAFDGSDAEADALHRENLMSCDAAIVFYGAAPKAWVDIKLREIMKAPGLGRETSIVHQMVYVSPPSDRRKGRYRSLQAKVVRQGEVFEESEALKDFVTQLKGGQE